RVNIRTDDLAARRDNVVVHTPPRGERHACAFLVGHVAAKGYRKHGDVTLKIVQPHTDLLVLDVDHRPDVNVLAPALRTQQFEQDVGKLLGGVIQLKGQQPGGVQETFEVVERAEDEKLLLIL